jgi:hypothetical protein
VALRSLVAGALLMRHWPVNSRMLAVAAAPLVAAIFIILLRLHTGEDTVMTARVATP